jgi:hypothetical protein
VRIEELDAVCREAARNLSTRQERPLPAAVVLPLPEATRVTTLPDFPDDDGERFDLLSAFARDVMRPANAPAYGFLAEATAADDKGNPIDVLIAVYGARSRPAHITAAPLTADGLGDFTPAEEVMPTAFPFLAPLQHAADAAEAPSPI